ncbi:MAG: AbrB/MazE/SpoVT family DNA-binding domain-containing protein [Negativicutes bacterium]|nr:AbrB/MazE/SpoVT family DNA-binding domain-containing protein [Negativicutes bacterium]
MSVKSIGIVRKLDDLGRLVIPVELRRSLEIEFKDGLEIFTENDCIILRKYHPACILCGSNDVTANFKGKNLCPQCLTALGQ